MTQFANIVKQKIISSAKTIYVNIYLGVGIDENAQVLIPRFVFTDRLQDLCLC